MFLALILEINLVPKTNSERNQIHIIINWQHDALSLEAEFFIAENLHHLNLNIDDWWDENKHKMASINLWDWVNSLIKTVCTICCCCW